MKRSKHIMSKWEIENFSGRQAESMCVEMLLTLNRIKALTPWQMSMLLWRAKIFGIPVTFPTLLCVSISNEQEKDEIRFMKGWKLKALKTVLPEWQCRKCDEIRLER